MHVVWLALLGPQSCLVRGDRTDHFSASEGHWCLDSSGRGADGNLVRDLVKITILIDFMWMAIDRNLLIGSNL